METEYGYLKDLRIIANRDLKDMVLVDNSVLSFAFQIDNGIPILPFTNDPNDEELLHLCYYLECLVSAEDVRSHNREAFGLMKLQHLDIQELLGSNEEENIKQLQFHEAIQEEEDEDDDDYPRYNNNFVASQLSPSRLAKSKYLGQFCMEEINEESSESERFQSSRKR